ncbi:MAG: hypothetical protein H6662_07890 [Ardenticatenaceae bacterium]|nr:hypothetical protein [Anaerolineales bacterium]MCB8921485.1 hypothetical protein [Ardenticatenaceae bacterium]MCB8990892.1 hypothetical protein [Ardenticatenaceae bacterium]MCB9004959.1 hypothetical protein [Ardenticatenaceae bacterium]
MSELMVMLDDRARLVTAVLAASQWPEQEQAQLTHAVHPHAKQTRQFVQPFAAHTAVQHVNTLLADGTAVSELFAAALRCTWPDFAPQEPLPPATPAALPAALADFARQTAVPTQFWPHHTAAWDEAMSDLQAIFDTSLLADFVGRLAGRPLPKPLLISPNLVYPALSTVLVETAVALHLIIPPPKAVGESPPWPYSEGPDWVLAEAAQALIAHHLAAALDAAPERRALLTHAAITLFLEEALGEADALAYMVRSKRQFSLPTLPLVVEDIRDALEAGRSI